jgi:hypothetical protein
MMSALLEAIAEGWSWKVGKPVAIVATNRFGNAIVKNADGHFFRIMPEEWQCELLAISPAQLEEERKKEEFIRDWEMTAIVVRAEAALGPLAEGEVYYLVMPGVLGGKYAEENIRKISLREVLACSGSMAKQMEGLPDGTQVKIVVQKKEPNQAPEPTAPSGRGSS